MTEIDEENETPETPTPQTPLIELNTNEEVTPDKVLNNNTNNCEKEKSTQDFSIKNCIKSFDSCCCCSCQQILRILFIIFLVIINYSPLVNGIIELILRQGEGIMYHVNIGIELFLYFFVTICLIINLCKEKYGKEIECGIYMGLSLAFMLALEIFEYFFFSEYETDHPIEFVNSFGKFRVLSFIPIAVIDTIAGIIVGTA